MNCFAVGYEPISIPRDEAVPEDAVSGSSPGYLLKQKKFSREAYTLRLLIAIFLRRDLGREYPSCICLILK